MTDAIDRKSLDDWTEADIILPAQLTAEVPGLSEPERRLRVAVLEDAIRYVQRYRHATDKRSRALYEDAIDWIFSPDRSDPFSFENVCDALRLDPDYVRRGVRSGRDAEPRSPSSRRGAPDGMPPSHRRAA